MTTTPLRRNRDFLVLWSGQVVSTVGSRASAVAFTLLVLAVTGSPALAGAVGFAATLPFLLLTLHAGALVDRWDRKRVMLVADAGRALALGSVAVAVALHHVAVAHVAFVAFADGALGVFFRLAEAAALPQVVEREHLPQAIAQNQAREQGGDLVGGPLGGALFGLARALPFVADAVSYAVSFASLLFVRPAFQRPRERPAARLGTEIREGLTFLWHDAFLRKTTMVTGSTNFVHAGLGLAVIVRARELGASPALVGALLAFFGVGALVGSVAAPRVAASVPPSVVILGALWWWPLDMALLAVVGEPVLLGVVAGAATVVGPPFNVVVGSYRYSRVPDHLLGRVQSAGRVVSWGTIPLGSLFAGFVVGALGGRDALLVLAALLLVIAAAATGAREIRHAPRPEAVPA